MRSDPEFLFVADRADPAELGNASTTIAESEEVFAELERTLRKGGLEFHDIVKTRLFYTVRSDYPEMNQVRDPLFRSRFSTGNFPAATGVITGGRGGARPHFELEVIAHPAKRALNAPGVIQEWKGVRPPFSHANIAGGVLFVSGQGAFNDKGALTATDPLAQAIATLPVLTKILEAADCECDDILCLTVYLTPPATLQRDAVVAAISAYLGQIKHGEPPIFTVIAVNELAFPGMEVEIELCARAPQAGVVSRGKSTKSIATGPAQATRHESFLFARSEVRRDDKSAVCFDQSFSALCTALGGVDAGPANMRMMTVWFSPAADRNQLEHLAEQVIGPDVALTLAPMPDSEIYTVIIEAFGKA